MTFRKGGKVAKQKAAKGQHVTAQHAMGFAGMTAGSDAILIDRFGLTDALLARRPPESASVFRAGHARRALPPGYLHARETGSTDAMDPQLAAYYARLRLVTSGPILSPARLRTVAGFLFGQIKPPQVLSFGGDAADRPSGSPARH